MDQSRAGATTEPKAPLPAESVSLPARGFTIDRGKALAAAGVLWAIWGLMVWLVTQGRTEGFDHSGLLLYRSGIDYHPLGGNMLQEAVRDVTALGGILLSTIAAGAAAIALLFLRLRREAMLFTITVVLGWGLNAGMKLLVGRERPTLVPHLTEAAGFSFPSGHSFASAMIYIGMALAFASLSSRHSVRYTLIGSAMVISAMIAWSRVMLGVHFPSDVIAGWTGGAAWAFTAAALLYESAKRAADSDTAHRLDPMEHH
ncbi:phosphatase PAP2 family protein [Alteriqipengyuania lutimaris]|uniref:PAP2 family protein n=1 Tax=Alteriqipengyuania lutimaris TaxID=1538146 RepID=A0A395LMB0_9SPHN|nr:phosphatase PAP2 family protein [Alteriqipengyuania lutimaris]MBB3032720.1 undecaprenyl-diphosphatase [Alteriqipengyuania lutimaris]RDS78173.1 PAP2 family protein [Alteriqipengyuania lutimaris]